MASESALLILGDEKFVSLTTFRKTGEGVATPVWIARHEGALLVTTPQGTGKVKRLRNNSRVELRASSRMGRVKDDAPVVVGNAEIIQSAAEFTAAFRKKYGLQHRLFMAVEKRSKREHVILRITD